MLKFRLILALLFFAPAVANAQQVIQKGEWILVDNGAPGFIWRSFSTEQDCQDGWQTLMAKASDMLLKSRDTFDYDMYHLPGQSEAARIDYIGVSQMFLELQSAICVQQ